MTAPTRIVIGAEELHRTALAGLDDECAEAMPTAAEVMPSAAEAMPTAAALARP